jgi:hypothetical protein
MRRSGPPAHSAAPPYSWSCPTRLSWTEIANIWAELSRVHRAAKDQGTTNQQVLTDGRSQNLAIGGDQPPLIILVRPEAPATSGRSLAALGRSRAPVQDADAGNNASDRKCLVLAQTM